ncbi:efflux RND transporter periplasmic adaptor subunit [Paremcibacter congregatus]|uniref:Efflux transporter periplasmic adaptor subunit n=1 Tax=Paremcibacter congregatus TaxID=2043170 RepID=A0A2G4YVR0_9PROT|nr:efflux RND transporter periplasmic adaptor subunit [Paremcibacter congregatus]PHZ86330.1 efflux transporter periplasmic adaptor subunit [Paremcibacter congregatus]QDE26845.1 efflux RND transporter periplasmic adaptor subunit [Paremcibacter congregatus]
MTEKKDLLSQLTINRDDKSPDGTSLVALGVIFLIALIIGIGAGRYIWGGTSTSNYAAPEIPSQQKNTTDTVSRNSIKPAADKMVPGPTASAQSSDDAVLDASGYIIARRMATVSAELTGRIVDVLVEEGMAVKQNQKLATLDDTLAQVGLDLSKAQQKSAQARVQSARASLKEANRVLKRVESLQSSDFTSEAALTNSILNVETGQAELARALADLEAAGLDVKLKQERLNDHTVRAPFAGVVTIKNAQPGEIVAPGSAGGGFTRTGICTIVDMASLEIEADVNEAFIGRIFEGQRVEANLDAYPQWQIPARVIAIIPTADRNKATVRVRIELLVNDPRILPEMGVKMSFYKE